MRSAKPWALPDEPATTEVLRAGGVTPAMILTQLRVGRLVRVRRGVYLRAENWPSVQSEQHLVRARAEVAANPGAVISHQSAAGYTVVRWLAKEIMFGPDVVVARVARALEINH